MRLLPSATPEIVLLVRPSAPAEIERPVPVISVITASLPSVKLVVFREVVVAFVEVLLVVMRLSMMEGMAIVDEAYNVVLSHSGVVVEKVVVA